MQHSKQQSSRYLSHLVSKRDQEALQIVIGLFVSRSHTSKIWQNSFHNIFHPIVWYIPKCPTKDQIRLNNHEKKLRWVSGRKEICRGNPMLSREEAKYLLWIPIVDIYCLSLNLRYLRKDISGLSVMWWSYLLHNYSSNLREKAWIKVLLSM